MKRSIFVAGLVILVLGQMALTQTQGRSIEGEAKVPSKAMMPNPKDARFVGTWQLVTSEFRTADGEVTYPLGEKAAGEWLPSSCVRAVPSSPPGKSFIDRGRPALEVLGQCPTLPPSDLGSTIGTQGLDFRVI